MGKAVCIRCKKNPEDIQEYVSYAKQDGVTPEQWVRENEAIGVWGKGPDTFYCTDCYIKAGMPLRRR